MKTVTDVYCKYWLQNDHILGLKQFLLAAMRIIRTYEKVLIVLLLIIKSVMHRKLYAIS